MARLSAKSNTGRWGIRPRLGEIIDVTQERNQLGALRRVRVAQRMRGSMQEFIRESAREPLEHLLFRRAASEQAARALDFGFSKLFVMLLQCGDRRHRCPPRVH